MRFTSLFLVALALALPACGGDGTSTPPPDPGPTPSDAATPPPPLDAGAPPAPDAGAPPAPDAGAPPTATAGSIGGTITRSGSPAAGGRGHLYVAIFDRDPVSNRDSAMLVASLRLEDVDMSAPGAAVPYEVAGIPPRPEPYFVTAFLDDNGTVSATDPSKAGPDRGDLLALDGFSSPQVTVSAATRVPLDLDLNFNLPF